MGKKLLLPGLQRDAPGAPALGSTANAKRPKPQRQRPGVAQTQAAYRGKVAVVCSWDVSPKSSMSKRSACRSTPAGAMAVVANPGKGRPEPDDRAVAPRLENSRYDAFTFQVAWNSSGETLHGPLHRAWRHHEQSTTGATTLI